MGQETKITKQFEERAIGEDGRPATFIVIEFTVGADGPFTERVPKADFTERAARERIDKLAREISGLRG